MKRISIYLILSLSILPVTLIGQGKSAADLIYEAIYNEEVTGDLDKAVTLLNEVLKNCTDKRIECAQALYHLGLVAELKAEGRGQKAKGKEEVGKVKSLKGAEAYYVQIIEKYPEVGDYAELARGRLAKLKDANTFVDPRDGHKYKWVKIGNQVWMAENLAYMPWVNPMKKQEYGIWVYDYDGEDVAEAKATENYQKYGCLYNWPMAMDIDPEYLTTEWKGDPNNHQGICPPGWHLPTDSDWMELEKGLGMPESVLNETWDRSGESIGLPSVGRYLKSTGYWLSGGNGNNKSGFNALPAGFWLENLERPFDNLGYITYFWTATGKNDKRWSSSEYLGAWYRGLFGRPGKESISDEVDRDFSERIKGYSVRCVKSNCNQENYKPSTLSTNVKMPDMISNKRQPGEFNDKQLGIELVWASKSIKDRPYYPKVYNSQVLLSTMDSLIHAVDASSGIELWRTQLCSNLVMRPIIDKDVAYFGTANRTLYAIDLQAGRIIWTIKDEGLVVWDLEVHNNILFASGRDQLAIDLLSKKILWRKGIEKGRVMGFAVENDKIFVGLSPLSSAQYTEKAPILYALDIRNGDKEWEYLDHGRILESPVIYDSIVCFGNRDNYYYAIHKVTGKIVWRVFTGNTNTSPSACFGNYIYLNNWQNSKILCVDSKQGNLVWSFSSKKLSAGEPLAYRNQIIVFDREDKCMIGIDPLNGKQLWEFPLTSDPIDYSNVENDKIFISCKDGLYYYDLKNLK